MPLPPDIWRWVGTIVQMFGGGLGQLSSKCSSTTATNGQLSSKSSSTTATLPPTFGGHLYRDFEPICVKKLSTDIFDILCGRSLREFLLLFSVNWLPQHASGGTWDEWAILFVSLWPMPLHWPSLPQGAHYDTILALFGRLDSGCSDCIGHCKRGTEEFYCTETSCARPNMGSNS